MIGKKVLMKRDWVKMQNHAGNINTGCEQFRRYQ